MNKIEWIENLRVIATISVIILHVTAPGVISLGTVTSTDWSVANFFDSLARFCVPVFVMITGTLILNKDTEIKDLLKNKLIKIIIPFLVFSFIYMIPRYGLNKITHNFSPLDFGRHIISSLINGSYYHLWYIYMLIGLYLITPIIRVYVKNAEKNNMTYFLLLWIIFNFIDKYYLSNYIPNFHLSIFTNFTGYFILGYYLSKYPIMSARTGWIFFISGTFITVAGTSYYALQENEFTEMFYDYNSFNVILQSIGIYTILFKSTVTNRLATTLRDIISKHSFNIYLAHALVLALMVSHGLTWNFINPIIGITVSVLTCLTISLFISILIKQIPFVNKYL